MNFPVNRFSQTPEAGLAIAHHKKAAKSPVIFNLQTCRLAKYLQMIRRTLWHVPKSNECTVWDVEETSRLNFCKDFTLLEVFYCQKLPLKQLISFQTNFCLTMTAYRKLGCEILLEDDSKTSQCGQSLNLQWCLSNNILVSINSIKTCFNSAGCQCWFPLLSFKGIPDLWSHGRRCSF